MAGAVGPCIAVAWLAAGAAQAPASPPRFGARVERVVVDAVVSDADGQPVPGLAASDFVVSEDGVDQTLLGFEAFTARNVPESEATDVPSRVSANRADAAALSGRTFAIVFDDARLTPAQGIAARKAVEDFLAHDVREGDRVLLAATSGDVWWGVRLQEGRDELLAQLARLSGRYVEVDAGGMSDAEAYRIVVQKSRQTYEHVKRRALRMAGSNSFSPSRGVPPPDDGGFVLDGDDGLLIAAMAQMTYTRGVGRLRDSLGLLERVLTALEGVHGRKSVVLVSPGFYHDTELGEFRRVADASRRANAPVSFLNATGLPGLPVELTAQAGGAPSPGDMEDAFAENLYDAAGAEVIAAETGGTVVHNRNDLARGLRRIVDESSACYLLAYAPTNRADDGRYRKLHVRLVPAPVGAASRAGWKVRARKGYDAPGARTAAGADGGEAAVRLALLAPFDRPGLPLRLTALVLEERTPGRAHCRLVAEVDVRAVAFREEGGLSHATLEAVFATAQPDEGHWTPSGRRLEMKIPPALHERLQREWYVVSEDVELAPGPHVAKLVVRDPQSGALGSVTHRLDVPDLDGFRLSTPVVSDGIEAAPRGAPPWPAAVARRQFAANGRLYVGFEVYRAGRDMVTHAPRVSARAEIVRPDGEPLTAVDPRPIEPAPGGSLRRFLALSLDRAAPGEHQLVVEVTDETTGRTLVWTEPFTVVAAARR